MRSQQNLSDWVKGKGRSNIDTIVHVRSVNTDILSDVRSELKAVLSQTYFGAPIGKAADKRSEEGKRIIEEIFGPACGRNVFAVVGGKARVELMIRRFGAQLVYYIERTGGVCKVFATIDEEEACTTYLELVAELQSAVDHPDERP